MAAAVAVVGIVVARNMRDARQPVNKPSCGMFGGRLDRGALADFNLLLITLDTVRRDHIGCYGFADARTPTIDGLATRGVQFDQAVTGSPSTLPSHCSMMTGLEVPSHGVRTNAKFVLDQRITTLAEVLKLHDYGTAAFVGTYVLDSRFGLSQGFDHYDDQVRPPDYQPGRRSRGRGADNITNASIVWLKGHLDTQPGGRFFVWAHYFDAHLPHSPPEEFARLFPDRLYDAEIAFIDSQIRRLMDFIEARDLTARTLIVLTSDHGEGLGEHGEKAHSRLVYDTTMRIPLIISCPPFFDVPGRIDEVTVATIDIMPTVLSLLGINSDLPFDGIDLATSAVPRHRAIYLETLAPLLYHGWASLHGLRLIDAKYIAAPLPEYYNLIDDPHELNNLLDAAPHAADGLVAELHTLMDQWPPIDEIARAAKPLSSEAVRRLASLGYVSTGAADAGRTVKRPDPKDMVPIFETLRRGSPAQWHRKSRQMTRSPDNDQGAYRRALILAETAYSEDQQNADYLTTLGMARYRLGKNEAALAALNDAERLRAAAGLDSDGDNVAFVAMALHQLGRVEEARAKLHRLRAVGSGAAGLIRSGGDTTQRFLAEADTLIGGDSSLRSE